MLKYGYLFKNKIYPNKCKDKNLCSVVEKFRTISGILCWATELKGWYVRFTAYKNHSVQWFRQRWLCCTMYSSKG